jgi:hypothetical protein
MVVKSKSQKRVLKGISVPRDIMKKAEDQMGNRRIRSFSNYVEILIAEDTGLKPKVEEVRG